MAESYEENTKQEIKNIVIVADEEEFLILLDLFSSEFRTCFTFAAGLPCFLEQGELVVEVVIKNHERFGEPIYPGWYKIGGNSLGERHCVVVLFDADKGQLLEFVSDIRERFFTKLSSISELRAEFERELNNIPDEFWESMRKRLSYTNGEDKV